MTGSLKQMLCPAPRRYAQELIIKHGLKTGLDIGCGEFSILTELRKSGFKSTGMDASPEMLESAREKHLHDNYMAGQFLTANVGDQYDVVVMSHVIEHFSKEDGERVLEKAEKISARMVYIETPYGYLEQGDVAGNPFQRHLSGWLPVEFGARGYTVFGAGIRGMRGGEGKSLLFAEFITRFIERSTQHLVFRRPSIAGTISAIRLLDENGRNVKI